MAAVKRFVDYHTFDKRKDVASKLAQRYPQKIAVIIEPLDDKTPGINEPKFMIPDDTTFSTLVLKVRPYIRFDSQQSIYFYVKGTYGFTLIPNSAMMSMVYERYKDADGFLYLLYSLENTHG